MLEFILCGVILLTLVTLYIGRSKNSKVLFYKVCDSYLLFVLTHAVYAFLIRLFFDSEGIIDLTAPFVLGYGPFFYLGLKSLLDKKLNIKEICLHFSPFIIFTIIYVLIVSNTFYRKEYLMSFYVTLYSFAIISMLGYLFWTVIFYKDFNTSDSREKQQLFKTSGISVLIISLLFVVFILVNALFNEDIEIKFPGIIIYSGIFISVVLAFKFSINNLIEGRQESIDLSKSIEEPIKVRVLTSIETVRKDLKKEEQLPAQKYNKSALPKAVLGEYKEKLDYLINEEKIYLDNELTLELLAKKMKMPMHHLTQLFNVYLGENFNQYINRFRINYACELLSNNKDLLSIEQIAFNSGFNSKVSFNRHFKNLLGYTPTEYAVKNKP